MNKTVLLAALVAIGATAAPGEVRAAELVAYWDFERVEADGTIKSKVGPYVGTVVDGAVLGEGRPGGGKGFDVSADHRGHLLLEATGADNPMNKLGDVDAGTIVLWEKNNSNVNSSSFWALADSVGRGWQFHIPWSNGTIYFDTVGCCGATQRLQKDPGPDHDYLTWHHYAFVKNGEHKEIYIDGNLLIEADGFAPLPTDFNKLVIGASDVLAPPDGFIDDFAIFKGALTQAEIMAIVKGAPIGAPPVDTDKDGMPDDWEKNYGFNPGDASDAAKDADSDGVTNLQEYKDGTDPADTTKPAVLSAVATGTFDTVKITFSEEVTAASATTLANYTITPSLAVTAATYAKKVVTLTTAKQTPGATAYTVAVSGVVDGSKNAVAAGTKAVFYSYIQGRNGVLKFSYWKNIPGNPVDNLLSDPRYPASPDEVTAVFSMNSRDALPTDSLEAYGGKMEGYITPTESASYDFFLRSDDASQLYLSTDDKPANLGLIAEETGCCGAFMAPGEPETTAAPIALVAGKKYYIQVLYKEGGGGDYAQVAWRKSTDTKPAGSLTPIPGQFLSAAEDLAAAPEGAYTTLTPGVGAKNVSPNAGIVIGHRDGKTEWTASNVSLMVDGAAVTPNITKVGNVLTISYTPSAMAASASVHTVSLSYLDAGGLPAKREWSYTTQVYSGPAKDKVAGYPAIITGKAVYTADSGGRTGKAGDYGMDQTKAGGAVIAMDASFLTAANAATAKDELSVAFWQKKHDTTDSSAFNLQSPTTGNQRTFHAHVPWSNGHIYFDTVGCCDGGTQRIEAGIDTFGDYTGDNTYWTANWHFFAFTKKGAQKQIWVDGKLFLEGENTGVMATDNNAFLMGADGGGGALSHAVVDDFSLYSKQLVEADVKALFAGTLPTALPTAKGLFAYWDFNDGGAKPAATFAPVKLAAGNISLEWTGGGTLQSADSVAGPWTDVAGATSPRSVAASGAQKFYRIKQ